MLFDLLGFLLLLPLGLANPRRLLYIFIWTLPFMAGNMIGPFFIPYTPWRSAIYCYLFCVFIKGRDFSHAKEITSFVLRVLVVFSLFTAGATLYTQFNAPHLDAYTQSPLLHGVRVLLSEFMFWLLPVALLWHIQRDPEAPKSIRHIVWAGVFYCSLGLLQFAVVRATGYDLFPIVRGAQNSASRVIQTVAGTNGVFGRINSICGEPRVFSLYCTIWFFLVLTSGTALGLRPRSKAALAALFFLTNILTVSRTGLAALATGLAGLSLSAVFASKSGEARRFSRLAWLLPVVVGVAFLFQTQLSAIYEASLLAERMSDSQERNVEVFGVEMPIEYQDLATITLVSENPWSLITGYGAGLWQYYMDPFEDRSLRDTYQDQTALDSQKQNVAIVARIMNFGLIGLVLLFIFYRKLYRNLRDAEPFRDSAQRGRFAHQDIQFVFLFWIFFLLFSNGGEAYIQIILIASASIAARVASPIPGPKGVRAESFCPLPAQSFYAPLPRGVD